mmetsp:Transcript_33060/g.77319  ORF Transcript_33060/g.77319 Transcript_33060/m.77319 type:complete len:728 (-) Transcript_33060:188-2371(-)
MHNFGGAKYQAMSRSKSLRGGRLSGVPGGDTTDEEEARSGLIATDGLEAAYERDPFTSLDAKWLCLVRPMRARETLQPWGTLTLEVVRARDLQTPSSVMFQDEPNAFVRVLLDDEPFDNNETQRHKSRDPVWKSDEPFFLNVLSPRSMVRLEVYEHSHRQPALIGFVEFCVEDVPMNREVAGWAELCFAETLQRTSTWRYARHCRLREDEFYIDEGSAGGATATNGRTPSVGSTATADSTAEKTATPAPSKHKHTHRAKQRTGPLLGSCCGTSSTGTRQNAGEILVKLNLGRQEGVGRFDSLFAVPIDAQFPKDFGVMYQEEDVQKIDAQQVYDTSMYIKVSLWDETMHCALNYVKYIIFWRNFLVSLIVTVAFIFTCWQTWLFLAVVPGMMGIALLLNAVPWVRNVTTITGANAPLNDEGFRHVCWLRSTSEVNVFLQRVISFKLFEAVPVVKDPKKLERLASRCFRGSRPAEGLTFDRLCHYLKNEVEWIQRSQDTIHKGSDVLVREHRRGKVLEMLPPAQEDGPRRVLVELAPHETQSGPVHSEKIPVPIDDVVAQRKLPGVPVALIPAQLLRLFTRAQMMSYDLRSKLLPVVFFVRDVVTWRKPCITVLLTVFLLGTCAFGTWLAIHSVGRVVDPCTTTPTPEEESASEEAKAGVIAVIKDMAGNLDNAFVLLIGLAILIPNAPWFRFFWSIFRIFRSLCPHRMAPKKWKFFRDASPSDFVAD